MNPEPDLTSETHVLGTASQQFTVRVDTSDARAWLQGAPVCREMSSYHLLHVGVAEVAPPYCVVRQSQSGAYFIGCFGGEGRILIDGHWRTVGAGMGCLLPPRTRNAFHAVEGQRWQFCWLRYGTRPEEKPLFSAEAPVLARFDAAPLRTAITGLHQTCSGEALPTAIHHWLELIRTYVAHFARPIQSDERLWRLWEQVQARLDADWNEERLAGEAQLDAAALDLLCQKQLGRNAADHVTHLRMRRAAELLMRSDLPMETIGSQVGYTDAALFSSAFKKGIGWDPAEFRKGANKG